MGIRNFMKNKMGSVVIIGMIVAGHYGWLYLQQNDALVPPEERKGFPLPIVSLLH